MFISHLFLLTFILVCNEDGLKPNHSTKKSDLWPLTCDAENINETLITNDINNFCDEAGKNSSLSPLPNHTFPSVPVYLDLPGRSSGTNPSPIYASSTAHHNFQDFDQPYPYSPDIANTESHSNIYQQRNQHHDVRNSVSYVPQNQLPNFQAQQQIDIDRGMYFQNVSLFEIPPLYSYYHHMHTRTEYPNSIASHVPIDQQFLVLPHFPCRHNVKSGSIKKRTNSYSRTDRICNICSNISTSCWYRDKQSEGQWLCRCCYDKRNRERRGTVRAKKNVPQNLTEKLNSTKMEYLADHFESVSCIHTEEARIPHIFEDQLAQFGTSYSAAPAAEN